jgi:hypothetical protein
MVFSSAKKRPECGRSSAIRRRSKSGSIQQKVWRFSAARAALDEEGKSVTRCGYATKTKVSILWSNC